MENNNQYDELLIKYLVNEVDAGERSFVEHWMNASEENLQYFKRLEAAWQLIGAKRTLDYVLDEMNINGKWNHFQQNVATKENGVIFNVHKALESESIEEQSPKQKSAVYRLLVSVAVAASVILVLGLGILLLTNRKPAQQLAEQTNKGEGSILSSVHHEVNNSGREKTIQLSDGSLIVLADKSELTYRQPFTNRREIALIGKAYFKVAKDKSRPFTVTSGAISTTALGTQFTVTAFENSPHIIVRLYEGKVVVKAVDKGNERMKKDVYLLPGQSFVYSPQSAKVKAFTWKKTAPEQIMNEEVSQDNPSIPQNANGTWYMFNNQPLAQVLDDLAALYGVPIIYHKKDIQNIYFTCKYSKSDSIEVILKRIGTLNDLTITKKDNAFVISK